MDAQLLQKVGVHIMGGCTKHRAEKEGLVAESSEGAMEGRLICKGLFMADPLVAAQSWCQPNVHDPLVHHRHPTKVLATPP